MLFLSVLFSGMMPLNQTVMVFPRDQLIIRREHGNGCFSAGAFYLAKLAYLIAFKGAVSVVIATAVFFMAGIHPRPLTAGNYLVFAAAVFVLTVWATFVGLSIGARSGLPCSERAPHDERCAAPGPPPPTTRSRPRCAGILLPNIEAAGAIAMPFLLIQILFSGFYLSQSAIPDWFIWAYWLSYFHYSLSILIKNLFDGFAFDECVPTWTRFCPFGPGRAGAGRLLAQYGAGPGTPSVGALFAITCGYAAAFALIGAAGRAARSGGRCCWLLRERTMNVCVRRIAPCRRLPGVEGPVAAEARAEEGAGGRRGGEEMSQRGASGSAH